MDETAEDHSRSSNEERSLLASSSPVSPISSTRTWESPLRPPSWISPQQIERGCQDHLIGMQSSPPSQFFEELFCSSQSSRSLSPLASAFMTSSGPQSDVIKQGYLGKLERNHRQYFVLRAGSHTGPSRLEWYKSQQKFTAMEKSAGKAVLFGSSKQGVIYLRCCVGVSRIGSTRRGHMVGLYAKGETIVLVAEDQWEQDEWYLAVKRLMEEERKDEESGEGLSEEDDGYCTLPPAAFFKEVWPVTVKPTALGCSKSLTGDSRLCLTPSSLILVRVGVSFHLPSVTIPLLSVRRFGHLDGSFFLELGRAAPNGPGELWMEARDQAAQNIHEAVREAVRALRVLPDFSRSPASNSQLQTLLISKRCRPKYRDKSANGRSLGSQTSLSTRDPEGQSRLESSQPDSPESAPKSASHVTSRSNQSAMEMKPEHDLNETGGWEPEEEEEGPGYMEMSPQVSHSSSVLPQDDYVTMSSPRKDDGPTCSPLQMSFNSFTSDFCSPVFPSHHVTEHVHLRWPLTSAQYSESETSQSQANISCTMGRRDDPAEQSRLPAHTSNTSTPVRSLDGSDMIPFVMSSAPVWTRPGHISPDPGTAGSELSVRRHRLSLCLPSCLQTDDT